MLMDLPALESVSRRNDKDMVLVETSCPKLRRVVEDEFQALLLGRTDTGLKPESDSSRQSVSHVAQEPPKPHRLFPSTVFSVAAAQSQHLRDALRELDCYRVVQVAQGACHDSRSRGRTVVELYSSVLL